MIDTLSPMDTFHNHLLLLIDRTTTVSALTNVLLKWCAAKDPVRTQKPRLYYLAHFLERGQSRNKYTSIDTDGWVLQTQAAL